MQMMNKEFGGTVIAKDIREDGVETIEIDDKSNIFKGKNIYLASSYKYIDILQVLTKDKM